MRNEIEIMRLDKMIELCKLHINYVRMLSSSVKVNIRITNVPKECFDMDSDKVKMYDDVNPPMLVYSESVEDDQGNNIGHILLAHEFHNINPKKS